MEVSGTALLNVREDPAGLVDHAPRRRIVRRPQRHQPVDACVQGVGTPGSLAILHERRGGRRGIVARGSLTLEKATAEVSIAAGTSLSLAHLVGEYR